MQHGDGDGGARHSDTVLKDIEAMIIDVGGEHQSTALHSVHHQRASAHSAAKAAAAKIAAVKDCLAADSSGLHVSLTRRSRMRGANETPSMLRGASMAGKDRPEKRYIGKGFQPPPAESPGPIYSLPSGFAEEALQSGSGYSFPRAPRLRSRGPASGGSSTPGPNAYLLPSTVGTQAISTSPSPASVAFPKAQRFNDKIFLSSAHSKSMHATDTPGPTAYFDDVSKIPVPGRRAPSALLLSSKASDRKVFISRAHVADSMGTATATADFPPMSSLEAMAPKGPAFSFGTGSRGPTPVTQPKIVDHLSTTAPESTGSGSQRRSVIRPPHAPTPGPGAYDVDLPIRSTPGAVILAAPRDDNRFWSKQLSTRTGLDSPGMRYDPQYQVVQKHTPAATIMGPGKEDRFANKLFIGKAFRGGLGASSPGPVYSVPKLDHGVAYTIVHKERQFPKLVFPGPSRQRWISRETAKDNMGAFSPGPKYNVRTDISKEGVAFSFGRAPPQDRHQPPSPSRQRSPSKNSAAPAVVETSPRSPARVPGVKISPPPSSVPRSSDEHKATTGAGSASLLIIEPKYDVTEPKPPAIGFPTADRFQKGSQYHTVSPGPVYTPIFRLVEPRVTGGGFGGLS